MDEDENEDVDKKEEEDEGVEEDEDANEDEDGDEEVYLPARSPKCPGTLISSSGRTMEAPACQS